MTEDNKFKFWCPIEKSNDATDPTTGEKVMRLGGIASTSDEDSDGEFLDPKGFDIRPLVDSGMVNWHHMTKGQPGTIIGEPVKAEVRPEGLYIETVLYPSSKIAQDVWELAETLEKDSKTRRLGYSIEGKVIERKSSDSSSPDFKKIIKAIITGVAITHQPKNPKTFANIIKGEIDNDFEEDDEEEKSLDTNTGAALKKESVDKNKKNKTFSKSMAVEKILKDVPAISIEKAERIHLMLKKISTMKGKKRITDEDFEKAYNALGLQVEETDINKGGDEDDSPKDEEKKFTKKKVKPEGEESEGEESEEEDEGEESEEEDEEPEEEVKKSEGGNRFDRIEKAITSSHQINSKYMKALGVMLKDSSQKLEAAANREDELLNIVKSQENMISSLSDRIEAFGSTSSAPKSMTSSAAIERKFAKSDDNEFGQNRTNVNANQISMSRQKSVVSELLDQATFAKGYDDEFSKACMHFDANKTLPNSIISRIKNEFGYEIIK